MIAVGHSDSRPHHTHTSFLNPLSTVPVYHSSTCPYWKDSRKSSGRESNPTRAMKPELHSRVSVFLFPVCLHDWESHLTEKPQVLTGWFPEVLNSLSTWVLERSKEQNGCSFSLLPLTHSMKPAGNRWPHCHRGISLPTQHNYYTINGIECQLFLSHQYFV